MNDMKWTLEMSLVGPLGERIGIAIQLDPHTAQEIQRIDPPSEFGLFIPNGDMFAEAVKVLKRREYRKTLFIDEARRLGTRLAERMEDKEGWHGVERQERLRDPVV